MANEEHLRIIKQEGVKAWNKWRQNNRDIQPDLRGADLRSETLQSINLSDALLDNAKLIRAELQSAILIRCHLDNADLKWANLGNTDMSEAQILSTIFQEADLNNAKLDKTNIRSSTFKHAQLHSVSLNDANISGTDFTSALLLGSKIERANLNDVIFSEANLSGCKLRDSKLDRVNLYHANLTKADLTNTSLIDVDLSGANLHEAHAPKVDFTKATIVGTYFGRAIADEEKFKPGQLSDRQKEELGFSTRITDNRTQNEPDYQNQAKSDESGHGRESTEQNVFRENLMAFLINEKKFPRERLNYEILAEAPELDFAVKHPDTNEFLAIFEFKYGSFNISSEIINNFFNKYKKMIVGKYNPFVYIAHPSKKSNDNFSIYEVVENTITDVSYEKFPTYNQLLFASPLDASGRRILNALIKLAKDKHDFNIHTPCQDYVDLQIKKNKRTAAQIHRLKDSDKNIALALAGYQEDLGYDFISNFLSRGDIETLSGYSNKHPGEKNWLEGNLGHQDLKYKAGVYILKPGVLVLEDIEKEVGSLLELAKKNAESKGPVELEENTFDRETESAKDAKKPKGVRITGNVATMADDRTSSKDLLGRESLVQALANMFVHTKEIEGFTVALFGNWGVGKSTVMELLEKQLKTHHPKRFVFAKFNAWAYEKTDNIAAGLAFEVVKALKNSFNILCRITLYICFIVREHWGRFIRWIIKLSLAALPFILLYLFRSKLGLTVGQEKTIRDLFGIGLAGGSVVIGFYVLKNFKNIVEHPLVTNLETCLKLPDYDKHLGLVPVLKRHIKILCGLTLKAGIGKWRWGKDRKLVVFVDDLDRCQPKCIAETLDAIRLVMDNPNVIVLIGIDHRIAFKAIEEHYQKVSNGKGEDGRGEGEIARDYLGKIIQLPIRLQEPTVQELEEFINKRLFPNAVKSSLQEKQKSQEIMAQQSKSTDVENKTLKVLGETPTITNMPPGEYSTTKEVKAPSQKIIEIETEMLDTEDEYNEFSDLAKKFGFSNPRQLLRLRNSYRLIKALELQKARKINQELGFDKLRDLMRMLFWQEFLFNRPKNLRQVCLKAMYEDLGAEKISDEQTKDVIKKVKDLILESFKDKKIHDETEKVVRIVVLPHSQED